MGTNSNSSDRTSNGSSMVRTAGNGPLKPGTKIPAGQSASQARPRYSGPAPGPTRTNAVPGGYNPGLPLGTGSVNSPRKSQRGKG